MKEKYWNPSLEKADMILKLIASEPNKYRLIDLSKELDINKSSMFSLLNTLERLGWIYKGKGNVYSLGSTLASIGASYLKQFNLLEVFYEEAAKSQKKIAENFQIGILDGGGVVYTGKLKGASLVQLVTEPGMKFPAYASSIGKALLSQYSYDQLKNLYDGVQLEPKTDYTITDLDELYSQLLGVKNNGYAEEHQESADGIHCIAAPIFDYNNTIIAAVSIAMTTTAWSNKEEIAREEIMKLAQKLSIRSGHTTAF